MRFRIAIATVVLTLSAAAAAADPPGSGNRGAAQEIDHISGNSAERNTSSVDGCPIPSPDGRSLSTASYRPGGHGGLDIRVARRAGTDQPFGAPENLPAPADSGSDDFCPTPLRGDRLLYASRRVTEQSCGLGDIHETHDNPQHGWRAPRHPACAPEGPDKRNSPDNDNVRKDGREMVLLSGHVYPYAKGDGMSDIYISTR